MAHPALLPALSARGSTPGRGMQDRSIADMEQYLRGNPARKPPEAARPRDGPQTARGMLEVNIQLTEDKKQRKAMQRKNSRDEFDRLLEHNRQMQERDNSQALHRRSAQKELSLHYKSKIGEKEVARANAYNEKLAGAPSGQYWPFREGENIDKERSHMNKKLAEEMQGYMEKQRQAKPPRQEFDPLVANHPAKAGYSINYPLSPRDGLQPLAEGTAHWDPVRDSHIDTHPGFLKRAAKPSGRRPESEVFVQKTLEDKVHATKRELEALSTKLAAEDRDLQDGMLVNDAMKYDRDIARAAELRRNARFLQSQMQETKGKRHHEVAEERSECIGYWGPEEKPLLDPRIPRDHCADLIKQMQVDQQRRRVERGNVITQERKILRNAMQEMVQDRLRDRRRAEEEKSVLTSTWSNQQKILETKRKLAVQ